MKPLRYLSVCSGIEAATVAWRVLGWRATAFAEIEHFPSSVLAWHYPDVPNLRDMTKINGADFLGLIDILVGGTPCQSFSVAGLRRGLQDERGNLALEFVRIADECNPPFIVWENVPGVLSDRGNAFGCFLAALAGEDAPLLPPGGKWTDAGYVLGPRRSIAWRVLDAQYFGLAQRRRRVFLVAYPRGGADPREILFESDGLCGNTPPGREAGPNLAGALTARFGRNGGAANDDFDGNRIVTQALTGRLGGGGPDDNKAQGGFYVAGTLESSLGRSRGAGTPAGSIVASECGNNTSGSIDVSPALNAHGGGSRRLDFESEMFIAHTLRAEGFDASEDGTGRQNLVVTPPLTGNQYGDHESREGLLVPTQSPGTVLSFHGSQDPGVSGAVTHALGTNNGLEACVAYSVALRGRTGGGTAELSGEVATALRASQGGGDKPHCLQNFAVRRLTPRECERLQGLPDDYTLIPYKRPFADLPKFILERSYGRYLRRMARQAKIPLPVDELIRCADGPRYKALGNSMAVPVMRWIGRRIERVWQGGII